MGFDAPTRADFKIPVSDTQAYTLLLQVFGDLSCECVDILGHGGLGLGVVHDGQDALLSGVDEASGAKKEVVSHGAQLREGPKGRALGVGAPGGRGGGHLEFAAEVVGEHGGEGEDAVGGLLAAGGGSRGRSAT